MEREYENYYLKGNRAMQFWVDKPLLVDGILDNDDYLNS